MSRLQDTSKNTIRSKIQAEQSSSDRIQRKQLKWYGHLLRMDDNRWRRRFTSEHRMVGGEEKNHNNHRRVNYGYTVNQKKNICLMDVILV